MNRRKLLNVLVSGVLLLGLVGAPSAVAAVKLSRVKASISNHYPAQYTYVTAKARALDADGHAIKGAKVVFSWYYKTTTPRVTKYTNEHGYAYCKRYISGATPGYKVVIKARATSGGVTKTASTWFIPHKN